MRRVSSAADVLAPGSLPWQARAVRWLGRRRRLSVVVPVVALVLGTPHSCPFC